MMREDEGVSITPRGMPTGIPGFDAIMDGGLPRGGVTVVLGGAGVGKTVFAMQVLAEGARTHREPGIMVAFEENGDRVLANTAGFEWGGSEVLRESGVHMLDASLPQTVMQGGEFDLVGLLSLVLSKAQQLGARRVAFDGLDVLLSYLGDPALVRREMFRLRDWGHASGLTIIVTAKGDAADAQPTADYGFLQFVADCVVTLHHRVSEGIGLRFIRVAKVRGGAHSANEFPITIGERGIEVAAIASLALSYPSSTERVSSGVERLDAMLSGGYYRGSSVLITGVSGTAKTSLAVAFADAAASRGETTLYVSFDEAPGQLIRDMASIGLQLAGHIESGTLRLEVLRARAQSPEAQVAHIRSMLRRLKPRNLVIDSVTGLSRPGGEPNAESAALQIVDLAKASGITVVTTSLLANAVPFVEQTPTNISTIADTWLHVTYMNQGGERNRALTVVKARGTAHSNQVRELVLTEAGVTLADVYSAGGEVLMGTLRWEKENEARRHRSAAEESALLRERKAEHALAETRARADILAREQVIQEAELAQVRADMAREVGHRASEDDELLQRRRVDRATVPHRPIADERS